MLLPETLRQHDKDTFEFYYIYFLPWKNQMVESIERNGGIVKCFSSQNNFQLLLKIWAVAKYVREKKIRLIHAHLPWAGILARIVGKISGVPVIYTEHNKQERYHQATRFVNLFTLNWCTQIIAVSSDVADSIHKHKSRLKAPVRIILNGVNTEHFSRQNFNAIDIRSQLKIPKNALIIGTIAVFRLQKRLDLWMDIANKIIQQIRDVHFVIVGNGPLKESLWRKRKELGLQGRIHMPGLETDVRPYLASFDIYMMTSLFEGLPIALLEAMAMECAVIATDAGGIKEVIRNESDGILCSVDEPEKLIDFALALGANKMMRDRFGEMARKRVIETFSMVTLVQELEALYKERLTGSDLFS